jgi:hypothetical protein
MNKKGFIFSLSAIYYAIVFMLFLSLLFLSVNYHSTIRAQEKAYYVNNPTILLGNHQDTSGDYKWCSFSFVYDANSSELNSRSELNIIKHCEDYEK